MLYPALTVICGVAQVALLYQRSPWLAGAFGGFAAVAILMLFAATRLRWDSHLDMYLLMLGPGGLGMMIGGWQAGPACHNGPWSAFWWMTAGMLLPSIPLCWYLARCVLEARRQGRGAQALLLDMAGMQLGMLLGHLPTMVVSAMDPRLIWLHHGLMLVGMSLGMLTAAVLQAVGLRQRMPHVISGVAR